LTFLNVLEENFIFHEKRFTKMYFKKRAYGSHTKQYYEYATCANLSKAGAKSTRNE